MLQFDESYFEGETRCDFYIEPMMKRAWAAILEVLAEFDRICKKHDLKYFAYWGTLLGAVRHKGYIPWDDDIDIAMLRPDYQKFIQIAPRELEKPFELFSFHAAKEWKDMLFKVMNGNMYDLSPEHLKRFHGCPYLVGIDVFPLDFVSRDRQEDETQMNLVNIVLYAANIADQYEAGECELEDIIDVLLKVEELCNFRFDPEKSLSQQARILGEQVCMLYQEEDADEVGMTVKRLTTRPDFHMPKEYYADTIEMPFENIMIPVPAGYDEILKYLYGDYMQMVRTNYDYEYPFYKRQQEDIELLEQRIREYHKRGGQ